MQSERSVRLGILTCQSIFKDTILSISLKNKNIGTIENQCA